MFVVPLSGREERAFVLSSLVHPLSPSFERRRRRKESDVMAVETVKTAAAAAAIKGEYRRASVSNSGSRSRGQKRMALDFSADFSRSLHSLLLRSLSFLRTSSHLIYSLAWPSPHLACKYSHSCAGDTDVLSDTCFSLSLLWLRVSGVKVFLNHDYQQKQQHRTLLSFFRHHDLSDQL